MENGMKCNRFIRGRSCLTNLISSLDKGNPVDLFNPSFSIILAIPSSINVGIDFIFGNIWLVESKEPCLYNEGLRVVSP